MPAVRRALVALTLAAATLVTATGEAAAATTAAPPPPPSCGGTNIARNGTAAASSQDVTNPPSNAIDGNPGTRWVSGPAEPQWITIDLRVTASLCRVQLSWDAAYARAFSLQVSNDGAAWTSVYATTTGTGGIQSIAIAGTGRYIRMLATTRATPYGFALWEFEVYATITATCGSQNAALGKPVTASSQESAAFAPGRAVDGSTATRWSSRFSDPQWIAVDLGAVQQVCRVVLAWETAYATAFTVQASLDGLAWTDVHATAAGTGGTQTIDLLTTTRYVRVYGTARATRYGYSLYELQVFSRFAA